ncbi:elongation of very long chain fatty acids protein 5 isoform X2 [Triplophysa dalaica]|uniref:elongation of very long chain fatty acids protein 5 isoform X2 n=1 Tax=Triplophysa dalaica TaxID=1582913 RepID=UPI0024DFDF5B|nr:elongation of very long chain fatty acids protein 5 isoform X2 [Triplophysa dalaica]
METFNHRFNTVIDSWMGPTDPRVRGWLLLDDYIPTFTFTVLYLLIVWMGPKYMKNKQAYSCRALLVPYNLGLMLLSLYMFYEMMNVLWWYYFSKLIEFMDTFFFILRKNNHQITFLHIYHHATMLNIWWFVLNRVPCGHSYFGATFNSFIHVLMYSYYGLSAVPALRPYLWWKKYITQGQLVQFVLTIFQTSCAVVWPCGFPMGWLYFQITYTISLILLFANFYIKTYKRNGGLRKTDSSNGSRNGYTNGVTPNEKVKNRKSHSD